MRCCEPAPGAPGPRLNDAVVWVKRDLRLADHAPLAEAAHGDAALALFIIKPAWPGSTECHPRHVAWLLQCLAPLRDALAARGLPLLVRTGEAGGGLGREFNFARLFSHAETGPGWSYERDKAVARWCRAHGVAWTEWPQTGVVRSLTDRRGWAARWQQRMDAPCVPVPTGFKAAPGFAPSSLPSAMPTLRELEVSPAPDTPPAKQALDHDPQGLYLRQWLPELGTAAYPKPIVDERSAVAAAKERLYGLRRTHEAHAEAGAIQHKHGSRKSGLPPPGSPGGRATAGHLSDNSSGNSSGKRTRRTPPADDGQGQLF